MKSYSELIQLPTFEERYNYLKLDGSVSALTFGHERYLNQVFYHTDEWRFAKREAIIRDNGCDLAHPDRPIVGKIFVHHLNPITIEDVRRRSPKLFDPDNLVCCSFNTHQAIHYGDWSLLMPSIPLERKPNDQSPWRKEG